MKVLQKTIQDNLIIENIATYKAETWELNKREYEKLLGLEMDFWYKSCLLNHKRNHVQKKSY